MRARRGLAGVLLDVDWHRPAALHHPADTPRPGGWSPECGGGVPTGPGGGWLAPCLHSSDLEDSDVVPLTPGPAGHVPGQSGQSRPQDGAGTLYFISVETGAPRRRIGLVMTETVGPPHLTLQADVGGVGGGVPHPEPRPGAGISLAARPPDRHHWALLSSAFQLRFGSGRARISDARNSLDCHPGDSVCVTLRVSPLNDFLGIGSLHFRFLIVCCLIGLNFVYIRPSIARTWLSLGSPPSTACHGCCRRCRISRRAWK